MRTVVPLLATALGLGIGLGTASGSAEAATGDTLFVQESNVALRTAPRADAPVALRVSRSYRLTEIAREGDWIKVEPYNVKMVGDSVWVPGELVGPEPRDRAPSPPPPDTATQNGAGDCALRLDADDPATLLFREDCPVLVVVVEDEDPPRFALFGVRPDLPDGEPPTRVLPPSDGIVPPFRSSPVPPFSGNPVPPIVPAR